MKRATFKTLLVSAVTAASVLTALPAAAQQYSIGTLPQGSSGYAVAAAMAAAISDHSDYDVVAVPTGGSNLVLPQVNAGEIEFATSNVIEAYYATHGTGNFDGNALGNLQVAAVLPTFSVGFLVPKDSDIHSATDLKGKNVPTRYSAMKLIEIMQEATLAAEGMTPADLAGGAVPNFVKALDAMAAGRLDAAFANPGSGKVRAVDAAIGVRTLGINPVEGGVEKMQELAPGSFLGMVEPGPAYPGLEAPAKMFTYEYALLVGKDVPEEVVYAAAKALYENADQLAGGAPLFKGWDPKGIYHPIDGVSFHPGAVKFFTEAGLMTQ